MKDMGEKALILNSAEQLRFGTVTDYSSWTHILFKKNLDWLSVKHSLLITEARKLYAPYRSKRNKYIYKIEGDYHRIKYI